MADTLKSAGQKRRPNRKSLKDLETTKTTKTIKTTKNTTPLVNTTPVVNTSVPTVVKISDTKASITLPGSYDVLTINNSIPQIDLTKYVVADPLNPPETLPQTSKAHTDKMMARYEGATNTLHLQGAAADFAREKFVVLGKQAKAATEGIKTATEFKKAEGAYTDYQIQVEVNDQKEQKLSLNQYQTTNLQQQIVYDKEISDEQLESARLTSETLRTKNLEKENKLQELQSQVGKPEKKVQQLQG